MLMLGHLKVASGQDVAHCTLFVYNNPQVEKKLHVFNDVISKFIHLINLNGV